MIHTVSIIIPTFKRDFTLERAIKSCLDQNLESCLLEIIVVDDNGLDSDYSVKVDLIVSSFRNAPIKLIKHKVNLNGAVARNTGIKNAKGDFIAFLDDDDWYDVNKIQKQLNYLLITKDYDACYCGTSDSKGNIFLNLNEGDLTTELLLMESKLFTPTLMFRKEVFEKLEGFNPNFKRHQDYELLLRYFMFYKIGFVNEILVYLGRNDGENILKDKVLDSTKEYFLNTFHNIIIQQSSINQKKIYTKHASYRFLSHLKNKNYNLSLNAFMDGYKISLYYFLIFSFNRLYLSILFKFKTF